MGPKLILGLAVVTVLTTVAAVISVLERPRTAPVQVGNKPAFPELRGEPDAAALVIIRTAGEGEVTLKREGERWVAGERYDYPVAAEPVRGLIVSLADMRLIEPKTANPERYPRLEVEDIGEDGAASRLVSIKDAAGDVLAEALIGKQRYRQTGTEPGGTYIRRPEEARSWLTSGGLDVETTVAGWLESEIVDLSPDRIRRVEIRPAGEDAYALVRDGEGEELAIEDLAEDEVLADDANLTRVTGLFRGLELEDVEPSGELAWPSEVDEVEVVTFDGLRLDLRLASVDGEAWLEIVSVVAEPATAVSTQSAEGETDEPENEAAVDPSALAAEIEARTIGWGYRIANSTHDRLSEPRATWLKDDDGTS